MEPFGLAYWYLHFIISMAVNINSIETSMYTIYTLRIIACQSINQFNENRQKLYSAFYNFDELLNCILSVVAVVGG